MDSNDQSTLGILAILLLLFLVCSKLVKERARFRATAPVTILLFGALLNEAYFFLLGAMHSQYAYFGRLSLQQHGLLMLRGALSALILYAVIRKGVSHAHFSTLAILLIVTWYLQRIVGIGVYLLTARLTGSSNAAVLSYYARLSRWITPQVRFPGVLYDLASAGCLVAITCYLQSDSTSAAAVHRAEAPAAYGGSAMSTDETTRLLCASAILSGQFRKKVLDHFEDRHRACAPEIGVDVPLVAQVCKFADHRERRYVWFFLLTVVVAVIVGLATVPGLGLVVLILAAGGLYLQKAAQERGFVRRYYQRSNFNAAEVKDRFHAQLDDGIADAFPLSKQNLIVYQGFTPFVGAGVNLGGWSFTVDINKPSEREFGRMQSSRPIPFTAEEFYSAIDRKIQSLRLERLAIEDYCFVSGADIRDDRQILPDVFGRPVQRLDDAVAGEFKNISDPRVRHYQWIRVHDWGNDLVMSYFFRSALRGSTLFVEINRFLLTPLLPKYREADRLAPPSMAGHVAHLVKSLVVGPFYAIGSVILVLARFSEGLAKLFGTRERERRRMIACNPQYNYGAQSSLRYGLGSDSFSHYFQKLDGDFYTKVLEHQILDGIVDFLDEHNIDTSEIRERRTTILNSGVIVQGGDVKAESLAVGSGATAMKSQAGPRKKRAAAREAVA